MSKAWKFYWLLVAATLALYLTMILWSLPVIQAAANGLTPFDMRPTGYSFAEAHEFLTALSDTGLRFYQQVQHRLDAAYPVMAAVVLVIALWRLSNTWPLVLRPVAVTFAIVGGVADALENSAVAAMLQVGPDGLTPELVADAHQWTLIKSAAMTVALLVLLVQLGLAMGRVLARRKSGG